MRNDLLPTKILLVLSFVRHVHGSGSLDSRNVQHCEPSCAGRTITTRVRLTEWTGQRNRSNRQHQWWRDIVFEHEFCSNCTALSLVASADLYCAYAWVAASCNLFRRTFAPQLCHFQKFIFYIPSQCMQTPQRLKAVFRNGSWAGYHECSECGQKFYSDENDPERPRRDFHRHVQVEHSEEVSSFGLP